LALNLRYFLVPVEIGLVLQEGIGSSQGSG